MAITKMVKTKKAAKKDNHSSNGLDIKNDYSVTTLKSYDSVRHIPLSEAYSLVKSQKDYSLPVSKLKEAVDGKELHVYEFKGEKYLDRLDIGRIYHQVPEKKEGLTIEKYFSKEGENPFDSVGEYHTINLEIKDWNTQEKIFSMPDAYFPKSWDNQVANQIVAQKYFFKPHKEEWKKNLKNKIDNDHESSPVHLINRVTNFIADNGVKFGYFKNDKDAKNFSDELKWLQINRRFAFNSPVQFNAGIYNEYGIEGSSEVEYIRHPETGKVEKVEVGEYIYPQSHACFIKGPRDDLESILDHVKDEGAVFSKGSGIGQNIGALRGSQENLSGGGRASGANSFLKIYDIGAGTIKSGGKSRRAARMTTNYQSHPDIMEFIRMKVKEDHKALTLMKAGYESGMDGEAVQTVGLQNTNLSVRIEDDFFDKLENGGKIELKQVVDGKVVEKIEAKRMLQEIAFGSWRIGDPAIQYDTKIHEMHPCKNSGRQQSTNPCSEYLFLNDTSCNLGSHNLLQYVDEKGNLNIEEFSRAVKLTTIASDILNDASSYPVKDIAMISPEFRTVGIGYCNLGALLMRKGLAYDSDEGRAVTGAITSLMTGAAYESSSEMAEKIEPFTHFEFNKAPFADVMKRHQKSLDNISWEHVKDEGLKDASYASWENVVDRSKKFGFRNAQTTVLAPTGTISFLMQADTTGIEPGTSLKITKHLAGGGNVTLVNREVPSALNNLGYDGNQIEDIKSFIDKNNSVIDAPHLSPSHYNIFDTAFGDGKGNGTIPFGGHVKMLGAAQPFISGAISKTCNLPESASVKDIYDSYLLGREIGLKALAVFRNNSKPTSALSLGKRGFVELKRGETNDLPQSRNAFESEVKIDNIPLHVIVSEYENGKPGQITFLAYKSGSTLKALLETSGILASGSLKRGVSLDNVVKGWTGQEFKPSGLVVGHPHIKTALSPLDYASKLLQLEYLGRTDIANDEESVEVSKLRGFKSGAFRTYDRESVDDWDVDQVLNDPEFGGFSGENGNGTQKKKPNSANNSRGVTCQSCGNAMEQTAPSCYSCNNCGEKKGGCGL